MPNFTVKDISQVRFGGEFAIEPDPAYVASSSEAAYLSKLKDTLTMLADDERQDNTNPLQPRLADARRQYRTAEAAKLRWIAQEFTDGKIDAGAAASATTEAAQTYAQNCPNLVAQDKAPKQLRFAGDFTITATNYQPEDAETAYIGRIASILDRLAEEELADKTAGDSAARIAGRQDCRKEAARGLRNQFEEFRKASVTVAIATDNMLVILGIDIAKRECLKARLFNVVLKNARGEAVLHGAMTGAANRVVDLEIQLTPGLPPPDDQPSQEK